jgi:hypothetical protein
VQDMDQRRGHARVSFGADVALPTYDAEVVKKTYMAEMPSRQSTTRKDILAREAHSLERIQ